MFSFLFFYLNFFLVSFLFYDVLEYMYSICNFGQIIECNVILFYYPIQSKDRENDFCEYRWCVLVFVSSSKISIMTTFWSDLKKKQIFQNLRKQLTFNVFVISHFVLNGMAHLVICHQRKKQKKTIKTTYLTCTWDCAKMIYICINI